MENNGYSNEQSSAKNSSVSVKTRRIQVKCSVTPEEHAVIQQKMKQVHQKSVSAYLRLCALCGLVLVVDDDAIKFLFTMLRRVSEEINEIAKTAHRTGEAPPSDMEQLFEHICYTWYAAGVIQYELGKQQKEVEERESNDFRVITFHPRRFPLKTKSVALHAYLSQEEYEYIQSKQLRTLPTVSAYLRQMAVYGYAYDLNKVLPYLPKMVFLVNSIGSNFHQILRVLQTRGIPEETYYFNEGFCISNIQEKVGDICRAMRYIQFEFR